MVAVLHRKSKGWGVVWTEDIGGAPGSKPCREFRGITGNQKIQQVIIVPTCHVFILGLYDKKGSNEQGINKTQTNGIIPLLPFSHPPRELLLPYQYLLLHLFLY